MRIADVDFWGHLRFGRQIVDEKIFPYVDRYSYTAVNSQWINHEWLSETIFYFIFKHTSNLGLLFFKIILGFVIAYYLYLLLKQTTAKFELTVPIFFLSVFTLGHFHFFRPQIFSYLFLALTLYILISYLNNGKKYLFFLPLIFIFWINCHGGFIAGLGMFFLFIMGNILENIYNKKKLLNNQIKNLIFYFIISLTVTIINPYSIDMYKGVLRAVFNPYTKLVITEWKPPEHLNFKWISYEMLIIFALITLFNEIKNKKITHFIILFTFIFLSLQSIRHIPLFAIGSVYFIANDLKNNYENLNILLKNFIVGGIVLIYFVFTIILFPYPFNILMENKTFPLVAVKFMKKNNFQGNIYNPFAWGECIIWYLYPQVKVSVDGRYDTVYPMSLIKKQFIPLRQKTLKVKEFPFADKTDFILLERNKIFKKAIESQHLWKKVYQDEISIIYVKKNLKNKQWLKIKYVKISLVKNKYSIFP